MLVSKLPDNSNNSPKAWSHSPFIVPSQVAWETLVTSYNDVMIICSHLLAGKPLHMCSGTTTVHLHICWHPCQKIPNITESPNLIVSFLIPFPCLWHIYYIYIYVLPSQFSIDALNTATPIKHIDPPVNRS